MATRLYDSNFTVAQKVRVRETLYMIKALTFTNASTFT